METAIFLIALVGCLFIPSITAQGLKKTFEIKTITEGMMIPWGLSWFRPASYANLFYNGERYLVICFRLPFYWRERDFCSMRIVWGGAVFRWAVGYDWPKIVWIPDYEMERNSDREPEGEIDYV